MKNHLKEFGIVLWVTLFLVPASSYAVLTRDGAFEQRYSVEGTVQGIYTDFISISHVLPANASTDDRPGQLGEFNVKVDHATQYEDVSRLTELKAGDRVKIEYFQDLKGKIATLVKKVEQPKRIYRRVETIIPQSRVYTSEESSMPGNRSTTTTTVNEPGRATTTTTTITPDAATTTTTTEEHNN